MKMRTLWVLLLATSCFGLWGCGGSDTTQSTGIPAGYEDLCAKDGMTCQTGNSPLNLVGTYNGTGKAVVTSNEIWKVNDSDDFTAVIATQNGELASGSFDLGSYHLDVPQANIRGNATQFTIFGTDSVVNSDADAGAQSNCSFEARVVITATQSTRLTGTFVEGNATLQFTKNISGPGCTQDQISSYPGTGATFSFTATRSP